MRSLGTWALVFVVASPAMAAFYEDFNYPDGALIGQGGWTGPAGMTITVDAGRAKLLYNNAYRGMSVVNNFAPVSGPIITWEVKVYAGGNAGQEGNAFDILLNDANGKNFARWYGGYNSERPRIDGFGQVLGSVTLLPNQWNDLRVEVNTVTTMSTFYFNGANLGSMDYDLNQPGMGNAASQITMGFQNADTSKDNAFKFYDQISVTPEPGALGLLLLGLPMLRRRR